MVLLFAPTPAGAQEPLFPGDSAQPPAFPRALTLTALAGLGGGQRATRIYAATPGDPACDTVTCRTEHALTGAVGLGARFQTAISPRMGVRLGVSYSEPKRKVRVPSAGATFTGTEHLTLLRAEGLLLLRLKAQVPVYFGAGAALARYSPGPVAPAGENSTQDAATEFGAAILIGVDRRLNALVGTRFEWTGYFLLPSSTGLSSEFQSKRLAFDSQLSFGLNFFLKS